MQINNTTNQTGQSAAATAGGETGQTGTQNASPAVTAQQQAVMAQVFSALLSKFMSVTSENANNQ